MAVVQATVQATDISHIILWFRYGGVEAALFVLLTTLNKQLEFEQTADIYMFAKLLYMKRPGVFRSKVSLTDLPASIELSLCTIFNAL